MPKKNGDETYSFAADTPLKPEPTKEDQKLAAAQTMLNWLSRWDRSKISLRDVRLFGPRIIRDQKSAILEAAEILVQTKWLIPIELHPPGTYAWRIIRKPLIYPPVAS